MKPLVSIIIPIYNGANYMCEAINSALNQTYENIEIIVVNDGSNDNGETERLALSYGDKIRYVYKENGGVSSALNCGIKIMNGEYFSWLSHDDVYLQDKIKNEIELINNEKDSIVVCNSKNINDKSLVINSVKNNSFPKNKKYNSFEAIEYVIKYGICGCSLLIPRKALEKCGLFDEKLKFCQDILMWWELFLDGYSLIFCDYIGVYSRIHQKQLTQIGSKLYHYDANYIGAIMIPRFLKISSLDRNILFEYAVGEAIHGNRDLVNKCIVEAKKQKLFSFSKILRLRIIEIYSYVRPLIRKVYYRIFRNIKVK